MKKTTFLLAFLLLACVGEVLSCSCRMLPDIKTKKDVEGYDFVALVKISNITDSSFTINNYQELSTISAITILELYKGADKKLKVSFDGRGTSCDMGVTQNETWIIFGNYNNGFITTHYCTYSTIYKNSLGELDWIYKQGWKELDVLRTLYQTLPHEPTKPTNGKYQEFYPDGKLAIEAYYKNGLLEGKYIVYYATGKLCGEEYYKKGKRNGKSIWYNRQTQKKAKEFNYYNNKESGKCFRYDYDGTMSNTYWYDKKGVFLKHEQFTKGHITRKFEVDRKTKDAITTKYYPRQELDFDDKTGDMIMKHYEFKEDKIEYIYTNDSTHQEKSSYQWDKNGKRTKKQLYEYAGKQKITKSYNQDDKLTLLRIEDTETYKLILEQEFDPKTGKIIKERKD